MSTRIALHFMQIYTPTPLDSRQESQGRALVHTRQGALVNYGISGLLNIR
jgi:hypothetical protein